MATNTVSALHSKADHFTPDHPIGWATFEAFDIKSCAVF